MTKYKTRDFLSFLLKENIDKKISKIRIEIFSLCFKKVTRQNFKSHKLKTRKCNLTQLKKHILYLYTITKRKNVIY